MYLAYPVSLISIEISPEAESRKYGRIFHQIASCRGRSGSLLDLKIHPAQPSITFALTFGAFAHVFGILIRLQACNSPYRLQIEAWHEKRRPQHYDHLVEAPGAGEQTSED
jgi:hypothetical protein